jgi:hypothetical protein
MEVYTMTGFMHLEVFEVDGTTRVKCKTELRDVVLMDKAAVLDSVLNGLGLDCVTAFILVRMLQSHSEITRVDVE